MDPLDEIKKLDDWSMDKSSGLYVSNAGTQYYSEEDWRLFVEKVCEPLRLTGLKKVIEHYGYKTYHIRGYIESISKKKDYQDIYVAPTISDSSANYHKDLFHYLFILPVEELPLYVNEGDPDLLPVVQWRLSIGK